MALSAPPLHRGGKPELKFFSYHRWSRYCSCGKRVTDSSQAVIISFVPTSFKSSHYLRPMRARDTAYFESYATDVFITPSFALFCWWVLARRKRCGTINVAINFVYEYFSFVIYFSKTFFQNFFFKIFFPKCFFNIFSPNFFSTFFFQNFFQHFFPKIFFSKIFFQLFFKIWFLRALLSMLSRLQRQNGLYVSVLWEIWYMVQANIAGQYSIPITAYKIFTT